MSPHKRPLMRLHCVEGDPFSHRIRIILAEKDISVEILNCSKDEIPEGLCSEYGTNTTYPILIAKNFVIREPSVIFEYLEESFPYPPLMSVFPFQRAQARAFCKMIDSEWMPILIKIISSKNALDIRENGITLVKHLFTLLPILESQPYLLNGEFSIVDCLMTVIFHNLSSMDVKFPIKATPLIEYAKRLLLRDAFRKSMEGR